MGLPAPRYEAHAKVTGAPIYAGDIHLPGQLYACAVSSAIAKGQIASLDSSKAAVIPGVVRIYTSSNAPPRENVKHLAAGGMISDTVMPLAGTQIHYAGQILAVAVAESFEAAEQAADAISITYAAEPSAAGIESEGAETVAAADVMSSIKDKAVGNFNAAFAATPLKISAHYTTASQHHNAMELYSTAALWEGDNLTIYEPSQFVYGLQNGLAAQLGLPAEKIRVISHFVGGAFGGKGIMTQRSALVAVIARDLGRPVKLVLTRAQGFTSTTYRAETKHIVQLAAGPDGKLTAYGHEGFELSSRTDNYATAGTSNSVEMYACPNVWSRVNIVRADRNTPGFMRSPPEMPYMYALESAMDELAVALDMDPVELRRINDTQVSPIDGKPYTSRALMQCFDEAASSFGWAARNPQPGSMSEGDWLIGYGCATAVYPTNIMPAAVKITLNANGHAKVEMAAAEVGQGIYSVVQQLAAEGLNLPMAAVTVEMGDTVQPPGPIAGGSMTTAAAGAAVQMGCAKIAARFGNTMPKPADLAGAFARLGVDQIVENAVFDAGGGEKAVTSLYAGKIGGGAPKKALTYAFGANFVEVRVHRLTREIRVPRMTGAFAAGRIINPRTARSQYLGGMIWGMEAALLEASELDLKRGRYINDNFAEYLIAVNADIPKVDIIMVPEVDNQANPVGAKGIGEVANVGMPAAVANAVFHATGKRIRDLPITLDKLF